MTMQVGMVGSDGIVLAGDMTCTMSPRFAGEGARYRFCRHKIKISDSRRVAVSSAMEMDIADRIADQIIAGVEGEEPRNRQRRILDIGTSIVNSHDVECIAAFLDPVPLLYRFQHGLGGAHTVCDEICDHIYAGDSVSPAVFWVERYHSRDLTVSQLIRLAAICSCAAKELNSAIIGGLEVVSSDASGFHLMPDDETRALEAQATDWSTRIGEMILGG